MSIIKEDLPLLFKIKDVEDSVMGIASLSGNTMIIVWSENDRLYSTIYHSETVLHKLNKKEWVIIEGGKVI